MKGLRGSADYWWNLISLDGSTWYHIDLMQDVRSQSGLQLRYDEDMTGYYWDTEAYPACPAPENAAPTTGETTAPESPETPPAEEPDAPQEPTEETPDNAGSETTGNAADPTLQNFR